MESINERFKLLRRECGKTQEEWAQIIGLSRTGIASIESGSRKVSEKHIKLLEAWKEKTINPDWLRTGQGDMFLEPKQNDLIARAAMLLGEKDPVFESFVDTYSRLSPNNRKILMNFLVEFSASLAEKKE